MAEVPPIRVEPIDIEEEVRTSFLDYAMSVIVSRALPDVRDGLKPVHRRILWSMLEDGLRPDRPTRKSATVVGSVIGRYHPHGDAAVYDSMVRMGQDFSLRYPLVAGQGNFGSIEGHPAAAYRYCVTGDTLVRTFEGTMPIGKVVPDAEPNTDNEIDLKVEDRNGDPVRATKLFHSGAHETLKARTREGYELTGTRNHPVLCLMNVLGVPVLGWKLLAELRPGDHVALLRKPPEETGLLSESEEHLATLAGRRSREHRVPSFVWRGSPAFKALFLRSLYEEDGSTVLAAGPSTRIAYSTRSEQLARDVQQLLLELGVVSNRHFEAKRREHQVLITNQREAHRFTVQVGFLGRKQEILEEQFARLPQRAARITPSLEEPVADGSYYFAEVTSVVDAGVQDVYSLRVDSDDHSFITNGFVSHNTEARLSPLAMEMLRNIDAETVDFIPNFDGYHQEPTVLPARFPNLLVNGSAGIAVGMATNIPPHNLGEVIDAVVATIDKPDISAAQLMKHIKGPDFPTGGMIMGTEGIKDYFKTGRGSIRMRARVTVEEDSRGRQKLVVTEVPYQVNPLRVAEKIEELRQQKRVPDITHVRNESSNRTGMRIVVELSRTANPQIVLNRLYKNTQLQESFGVINLSLVDGVPRTLGVPDTIKHYIDHQREVVTRRTRYELRKAEERDHIVAGLLIALANLDAVIKIIRGSADSDEARTKLMKRFKLSEIQANHILDMPLRRLTRLEREKLEEEHRELTATIKRLKALLKDPKKILGVIKTELAEIKEKYGDPRRTELRAEEGDIDLEELVQEQDVVVTVSRAGYVKRLPMETYRRQGRGGRGIRGANLKEEDVVAHVFTTTTRHWLLFFTTSGKVYRVKTHEVPEGSRTARGTYAANLPGVSLSADEKIASVIAIKGYDDAKFLLFATQHGMVKKTPLAEYDSPRTGLAAITLRKKDRVIGVRLTSGKDDVILVSRDGQAIRFQEKLVRPMGRPAAGVIGMRLGPKDVVLAMALADQGEDVVSITEAGFGKRTPVKEYPRKGRGGKGVVTHKFKTKADRLAGAFVGSKHQDVFVISTTGIVIRISAEQIRRTGRPSQGVRVMKFDPGVKVAAVAPVISQVEAEQPPLVVIPGGKS